MTYLRDAFKDGPARSRIQGLTQTAESYQEAIKCLKERYDRPSLTHREHVRSILQGPPLKANNSESYMYTAESYESCIRPLQPACQGNQGFRYLHHRYVAHHRNGAKAG